MRKHYTSKNLPLIFFLLLTAWMRAQSNDCATATLLTPGTVCSPTAGTTVGATQSIAALTCSGFTGNADDDVWYRFVATTTSHTVTVAGGSGFDAVVDVRSGACSGTNIGCADSTFSGGTETVNLTGLTVGTNYYIRVYSYGGSGSQGSFTICVTSAPAASGVDNCAGTAALTVNPAGTCSSTTSGTTVGATLSQAGCAGTADDDVWYSFTATSASHTVTVTPGTLSDAVLQVFSGTCAGLTSLGCADATVGSAIETLTLNTLTPGVTYFVRTYSWSSGSGQGTFSLCVTTNPATGPANNNCSGAIALVVNPAATCSSTTSGTTIGATQSQAGCAGTADDDVWYSFTATNTSHTVTVTPGTLSDAVLQVFSGSCAGLVSLGCADSTVGSSIETLTLNSLTVGATYYVRTYSWGSAGQGTFSMCVTTAASAGGNDNCSGATTVGVNATMACTVTASGTTVGATQSQTGCFGTADDDVWYSFTATSTTHVITVTPGTLYDAVFQVFSGTCGVLTSLACVDSTISTAETTTLGGLTSGATYFVRIYSYSSGSGQGTFTLCVTTPTPPANNNCSGAFTATVNPTSSCTAVSNGTTQYATQSQPGCVGSADDDVWYTFTATNTSHTISLASISLYDGAFEVFSGLCGSLTSIACVNNSSGFQSESTVVSGLTVNGPYFIRVYSYGASASDSGTFTLCITTCSSGDGTGTSSLACPSVISGGLGLNGADPAPIDCTSASCTDLEATYLQLGQTSSYTVSSIPYAPPYQFTCLANPVSVNVDDVWSPIVSLPFNFCFYGVNYDQCLISSNGVITFDLSTYSPGGYSTWSFASNLPNNTLFLNSIFGAYHDIDPSLGGSIGWELISLDTGCRALVAAWNDVPMFSCTSVLYSGMIVLYENTNIIEVYIEEKNVCASWNAGNAIIGIQNQAGNLASVAPGRNGLDPNWTVTNEAWRFTPAGPSLTTLQWFEGSGTTGPMIGTTDVLNVCPTATTTYTAQVTYTFCNGATLIQTDETTVTVNLNKVWNGSVSSDWNVAANWTPAGVPTAMDCVVIPNVPNPAHIIGTSYDAYCYSLNVLSGGILQNNPGNNLTVTNAVNVQAGGQFILKNSSSLLQVNNVANNGIMNMERITPPVYRFDYTYWNSPVTQASNFTLGMLSPNTQYDKYYSWTPSVSGGMGIWAQESAATVMNPTKGYIVRAPNSYSFTPDVTAPYTANFIGTPNNGTFNCPVSFGSMGPTTDYDKWNLLGNPYPSAVNASAFINHPANVPVLDGTLYFWTHNSPISVSFADPFYGDYVLNYTDADYAAWNETGGTAATSGGAPPGAYIAAGQSFFVRSLAVPGTALFNNAMRTPDNNAQFFRSGANAFPTPGLGDPERHRIWLNLRNDQGAFSQILVGYVEGATMGYDRGFDGALFSESSVKFYSHIPEKSLVIQGRPLPFEPIDQVPLGVSVQEPGTFSIRIDHYDAFFDDVPIYLEDLMLGMVHDLKASPYEFSTAGGIFNDRFVLRYSVGALSVPNPESEQAVIFIHEGRIHGQASQVMSEVRVFDAAGKLIKRYIPGTAAFNEPFEVARGFYPTEIHFADGSVSVFKLMH